MDTRTANSPCTREEANRLFVKYQELLHSTETAMTELLSDDAELLEIFHRSNTPSTREEFVADVLSMDEVTLIALRELLSGRTGDDKWTESYSKRLVDRLTLPRGR